MICDYKFLLMLYDKHPSKIELLAMCDVTGPTCQFVIKCVNKVNQSLIHLCNENVDVFLIHYVIFKHTTFKCTLKNDGVDNQSIQVTYS